MTITYIRWRDASSEEAAEPGTPIDPNPLVLLHETGFLMGESATSVSICLELNADGTPSRFRLHIPKVNIEFRRDMPVKSFSRKRSAKIKTEIQPGSHKLLD